MTEDVDYCSKQIELRDAMKHMIATIDQLESYYYCMSYNDSYFGEPEGLVKRTIKELSHTIDGIKRNKLL